MAKNKFVVGMILAAAATLAGATPLTFDVSHGGIKSTGATAYSFTVEDLLVLPSSGTLSGWLTTVGLDNGDGTSQEPWIDITTAYLYNSAGEHIDLTPIVNLLSWTDEDLFPGPTAERFELASQPISAGNWTLKVSGLGYNDKDAESLLGKFEFSARVPEPASLALALTGLGLAGVLRRRNGRA